MKLENISLNHLAENNSDEITFCPTAGCYYMCSYDKNEFHLNCPICKKSYCLQCKTEWHKGMTCKEYQITKNKDENDVKFEEYAKGSKLKQCPKCKRYNNQGGGLFGNNYYRNNYQGDSFGSINDNYNIYDYQNNDLFGY